MLRATASEPSSWLRMGECLLFCAELERGRRGGDIPLAGLARELLGDGHDERLEPDLPREGREAAEQRGVGERPAEVLASELCRGKRQDTLRPETLDELAEPELVEAPRRVEQEVAVRAEAGEQVDLVEERRVLDDQCIRFRDRLANANRTIVEAAERDHRGTRPLRSERREGLGMAALTEGSHRQELGRRDDALAASSMDSNLEQPTSLVASIVRSRRHLGIGSSTERDAEKPHRGSVAARMVLARTAVTLDPCSIRRSFSATLRVHLDNQPGSFARLAQAIGDAGGLLGAIDLVRVEQGKKVRDVTVLAADEGHLARIVDAVRPLPGIEVEHVSDRTFLLHLGGKLGIAPKVPLKTRDDLSMAYTPGVARVCRAIADEPDKVWNLTMKQNTVAVVTDGTAVLGLGDIGPEAALPVMEGKAILFKEFAGIDAWPICLATTDTDEIVRTVAAIAPVFGGINLEDISAPRCFEIERRLREELDIPVFHDDQHGTAVVVLAALINALGLVNKRLEDVRIVITGAGAAGAATARMLLAAGAADVVCCDRRGVVATGREGLDPFKAQLAEETNPRCCTARPTRHSRARTSSSGFPAPEPSAVTESPPWPSTRSSSRWRTPPPRSPSRTSKSSSR